MNGWKVDGAPEDALVQDVVQVQASISCGYFSPDHISVFFIGSTDDALVLSSNLGGAKA